MATVVTRYVDPNSTAGGNGTTNALTGANRAYVSLSAWEAAEQKNLVTADEIARVVCSSDDAGSTHAADTTAVTIDGWTTDATRYIQIEAASSHGGKWNDNIYRIVYSGLDVDGGTLNVAESYVRVNGLQIGNTITSNANYEGAIFVSANLGTSNLHISNCILTGGRYTLRINDTATVTTTNIWNTVIYGGTEAPVLMYAAGTMNLYSCTLIGPNYGIRRLAGTVVAKNCYARGPTNGAYVGTISQTTCAAADATATGASLDNIALNTTNFTNVTAGSEDYHLPAGSALIDVGTDTSGDSAPLNFTDDIDGVTRTGTWDIGADEYVSAGASNTDRTPTIGSLGLSGVASRNDRGLIVPTEVDV